MKVLAFAASSSRQSINKQLVTHAVTVLEKEIKENIESELLDLNDFEMPIYSIDRENEGGIPELAKQFFTKIGEAEALIISFAEHNGTYTAAYKNIFDWASRIDSKVFQGKPMVIMSASPGPGGAASVLKTAKESAPFFGADIKASFSVASYYDVFDSETGQLADAELSNTLRESLAKL
ncbi:NAD(P)H-dependent oxidoreductase [Cocleimonas flava]|uniref:NAD(P)H-dependent FMN reductase n=1 Tax=Cocleimonas flava TaxID=634765 RepID=A0A4R1FCL0_9GAMM|nr:NAD(P)H-dependent oxidoreductase [Cocleimonas flava]TCJ88521.1 NAD(P)H-dependent FMN reductase [Cocleimonas flava]